MPGNDQTNARYKLYKLTQTVSRVLLGDFVSGGIQYLLLINYSLYICSYVCTFVPGLSGVPLLFYFYFFSPFLPFFASWFMLVSFALETKFASKVETVGRKWFRHLWFKAISQTPATTYPASSSNLWASYTSHMSSHAEIAVGQRYGWEQIKPLFDLIVIKSNRYLIWWKWNHEMSWLKLWFYFFSGGVDLILKGLDILK